MSQGRRGVYFCVFLGFLRPVEIKVSDIRPEGMAVELIEEAARFADLGEDMRVLGPVSARFRLNKTGVQVSIDGEMEAELELTCSRCGRPFTFDAGGPFSLELVPLGLLGPGEEGELHAGDMEVAFYGGDVIDLLALLREQMLLKAPMKPLCTEQCKGICQFCGQDLNERLCGCGAAPGHPGLAGLKDQLKDKK